MAVDCRWRCRCFRPVPEPPPWILGVEAPGTDAQGPGAPGDGVGTVVRWEDPQSQVSTPMEAASLPPMGAALLGYWVVCDSTLLAPAPSLGPSTPHSASPPKPGGPECWPVQAGAPEDTQRSLIVKVHVCDQDGMGGRPSSRAPIAKQRSHRQD